MLGKLKCWLGYHSWDWHHKDDALDALCYLMQGTLSRYEIWRTEKRLLDCLEVSKEFYCRRCGVKPKKEMGRCF